MTKNVLILGGGTMYAKMWMAFGYNVVALIDQADVVQFTGGADVTPSYYGEELHPSTGNSVKRDEVEAEVFAYCVEHKIKMAGICRGGQFLNVMNGGKMFQDADGHAIGGTHHAKILATGAVVDVSSTHHQIMRPNYSAGIVLMESAQKRSSRMEHVIDGKIVNVPFGDEVEAIYYPTTQSLCFQPHPEFYAGQDHPCVLTYRMFLRNYLELDL